MPLTTKINRLLIPILPIIIWAYLIASYPASAQERRCPPAESAGIIVNREHRLYYLKPVDGVYELWYYNYTGDHQTSYSVPENYIKIHLSPDRKRLMTFYQGDSDNVVIEIVDLIDESVDRWELLPELNVQESPATGDWVSDTRIGFELVSSRRLLIQDVYSHDITILDWPDQALANMIQFNQFPIFSLNYEYVVYPIAQDATQTYKTYALLDISSQEVVAEFQAVIPPQWSLDSNSIYYVDANYDLAILNSNGEIEVTQMPDMDAVIERLSPSPSGDYLVAAGRFVPQTAIAYSVILLIDTNSGETFDLCTYGSLYYSFRVERGRGNSQIGVWSEDGVLFAYPINTLAGRTTLVLDLENYTQASIPFPESLNRDMFIIGWVSEDTFLD